jgi:hypothetical protein
MADREIRDRAWSMRSPVEVTKGGGQKATLAGGVNGEREPA